MNPHEDPTTVQPPKKMQKKTSWIGVAILAGIVTLFVFAYLRGLERAQFWNDYQQKTNSRAARPR